MRANTGTTGANGLLALPPHRLGTLVVDTAAMLRSMGQGSLVAIDGPNHGIINCSPDPANYFQAPAAGGFVPTSEVCAELGSPNTPFLKLLNKKRGERAGLGDDPDTLVIRWLSLTHVVVYRASGGRLLGRLARTPRLPPNSNITRPLFLCALLPAQECNGSQ